MKFVELVKLVFSNTYFVVLSVRVISRCNKGSQSINNAKIDIELPKKIKILRKTLPKGFFFRLQNPSFLQACYGNIDSRTDSFNRFVSRDINFLLYFTLLHKLAMIGKYFDSMYESNYANTCTFGKHTAVCLLMYL